mmetsp:Transcript_31715/g.90095  ORF Transcript_31715/g.90095 Transcript_31715/m.90095 type:complete len:624 (+) Transcript_31715:5424-7295(+)
MARGVGDDARDAADVLHGVLKQHQVHQRVGLIVLLQGFHQGLVQPVEILHLVVNLVAQPLGKVAEDERLGVILLVVVIDVRNGEKLLARRLRDLVVRLQVSGGHQPVGIHTLALVQPQPGELHGVVKLVRGGHEQALEHVGEVSDRELVMEVDGGFPEAGGNLVVQSQGSLQDLGAQVLDAVAKLLEMAVDEGSVDLHQGVLSWELDCNGHEQPLQARVDDEASGRGVHAGDVLRVVDVLLNELRAVKPVAPAQVLADERDGHGGLVEIQLGHVQVVHEVDERLGAGWAKVDAGLLLQRALQDALEGDDVREVVEGDGQAHLLLPKLRQLALHQLGLTHPGTAHEHDGLLQVDHEVQEEAQRGGLRRGHKHSGHGRVTVVLHVRHQLGPRLELASLGVDKVVVHCALARELDGGPRLLEPLVEVALIVYAVLLAHAAAKGPHHGEDEVQLKQLLRRLVVEVLWLEQTLYNVNQAGDVVHGIERRDGHKRFSHLKEGFGHVLGKQLPHPGHGLLRVLPLGLCGVGGNHPVDPRLDHVVPLLGLRDVEDAGARGGGRCGKLEVTDLKDELHVGQQADALVGGQRQQAVVVHDAVHGLDPVGVQVAVQQDPLGVLVRQVGQLAHVV